MFFKMTSTNCLREDGSTVFTKNECNPMAVVMWGPRGRAVVARQAHDLKINGLHLVFAQRGMDEAQPKSGRRQPDAIALPMPRI